MATVAQFIEENKSVVNALAKAGQIPTTVLRSHQIYKHYEGLDDKSKMDRYEKTATAMRVNTRTVMNCIKDMQKPI